MTMAQLQKKGYDLTKDEVAALNNKMLQEYKIALEAIRKETSRVYTEYLSGVDPDDFLITMNRYDRLPKYKAYVQKTFTALWAKASQTIIEGSELAFGNSVYYQEFAINWMLSSPYFEKVNEDALAAAVLGELKRKVDMPLISKYGKVVDTLGKNKLAIVSKLDSIVSQGIIQGKGVQAVSNELKDVLNISANKAMQISRTEVNRVLNSGAYSNYLEMKEDGIDLERKLLSTLDMKTRKQSGDMDGQIATEEGFKYPNGNRYPIPGNTGVAKWDVNDRETVLTIIDGETPDKRSGRNPATGKSELIDYVDFPEWAESNGLKRTKSGKIVKK